MEWLKRKLITWGRVATTGFHNFFRNLWLATAATAMMFVTLTIIFAIVISNVGLNESIDKIAGNIKLSIYLQDTATQAQQDALKAALQAHENVESIEYVSKEQALLKFKELNPTEKALLQSFSITGNVLPASFEVKLKDLTKEDSVVGVASQDQFKSAVEGVSDIKKRRDAVNTIVGAQKFITRAGVLAGGTFALISILIIFNTIRMAIYTRSYEIEIMKLIGATAGYIRGPFLFEAGMYGIIAGLLAFAACYSPLTTIAPQLVAKRDLQMEETLNLFTDRWYLALIALIGAGLLIGLLSGSISMARYLRLGRW